MQLVADEAVKQKQLDTMKRRATALLVGATVVFLVAHYLNERSPHFWWGALAATAEAAMIGGLADWFAVTAIFRHPLGIPIPHTAIVPRRKDRVGRTLGAFVQRNFLAREVIERRLQSLHAGERLARWLAEPENARTIARHAARAMTVGAELVRDEDAERVIGGSVAKRVRAIRAAPLVGRLLQLVTERNRHQELLSELLHLTARGVDENRELIRERIERESPWWVPEAVDDKIYQKVLGAIERTMIEIEHDLNHPLRQRFDAALRRYIERLEQSPETAERIESWKDELLTADAVQRFSASLWTDSKAALIKYVDRTDEEAESGSTGAAERTIVAFAQAALADPELLERVNAAVAEAAVLIVARYQDEVAELIAHTVASWDPDATSKRIELAIGRDLQFIRINGTLVGGLAGLMLYFLRRLL